MYDRPWLNEAEKKLIRELREGKRKQHKNSLRGENDSFCCLGVACDISKLGNWADGSYIVNRAGGFQFLPRDVMDWLGWSDSRGGLQFSNPFGGPLDLAMLNDYGFTFDQIADVIEAGLVMKVVDRCLARS